MNRFGNLILATMTAALLLGQGVPSAAIEGRPLNADIRDAIAKGKEAAHAQRRPDVFRITFGSVGSVDPGGFLLTKLASLSVMAAHMALRGTEPSQSEIDQVIDAPTMLVSAVIFGDTPSFAVDSYLVLEQGAKTIKPVTVRADGTAERSAVWPNTPRFKGKLVGSFSYADFNPRADTTIIIFPAGGGEIRFFLNFADFK